MKLRFVLGPAERLQDAAAVQCAATVAADDERIGDVDAYRYADEARDKNRRAKMLLHPM